MLLSWREIWPAYNKHELLFFVAFLGRTMVESQLAQTKLKLGWLRLGPAHFPQNRGPGPALARCGPSMGWFLGWAHVVFWIFRSDPFSPLIRIIEHGSSAIFIKCFFIFFWQFQKLLLKLPKTETYLELFCCTGWLFPKCILHHMDF